MLGQHMQRKIKEFISKHFHEVAYLLGDDEYDAVTLGYLCNKKKDGCSKIQFSEAVIQPLSKLRCLEERPKEEKLMTINMYLN